MARAVIVAMAFQPPPRRWSYFAENPSPYLYGGNTGYTRKFDSFDSEERIPEAEREEVSAIYDPLEYTDDPLVDVNLYEEPSPQHAKQDEIFAWSPGFMEQTVRNDYLRQIYGILCLQMILFILTIATFRFTPQINNWMSKNPVFLYSCVLLTLILVLVLHCHEWLRWKYKINVVSLVLLTIAESVVLAASSAVLQTNIFLLGVTITAILCLTFVITLSLQTDPVDFTKPFIELLLTFLSLCIVISILIVFFLSFFSILSIVFVLSVVFLLFIYFIVDTNNMVGNKNRYGVTADNPVFAVLNLYIDIVELIIFILSIFYYGCCSRNEFVF